jgi:hypothetical protein
MDTSVTCKLANSCFFFARVAIPEILGALNTNTICLRSDLETVLGTYKEKITPEQSLRKNALLAKFHYYFLSCKVSVI